MTVQVARYISALQQPDGSFFGDEWGEVDTRFSYCALSSMAILGELDSGKIDVKKAAEFVGRQVPTVRAKKYGWCLQPLSFVRQALSC